MLQGVGQLGNVFQTGHESVDEGVVGEGIGGIVAMWRGRMQIVFLDKFQYIFSGKEEQDAPVMFGNGGEFFGHQAVPGLHEEELGIVDGVGGIVKEDLFGAFLEEAEGVLVQEHLLLGYFCGAPVIIHLDRG